MAENYSKSPSNQEFLIAKKFPKNSMKRNQPLSREIPEKPAVSFMTSAACNPFSNNSSILRETTNYQAKKPSVDISNNEYYFNSSNKIRENDLKKLASNMMQSPNTQIYKYSGLNFINNENMQSPILKKINISLEETNSSVVSSAKNREDYEFILRKNSELERRLNEMEKTHISLKNTANEEIIRAKVKIEGLEQDNDQLLKSKDLLECELKRLRKYYADLEVEIKQDHQNKLKVVKDLEDHLNTVITERDEFRAQLNARENELGKISLSEIDGLKKSNEEYRIKKIKMEDRLSELAKENHKLNGMLQDRDSQVVHFREEFDKYERIRQEELSKIKLNMSDIQKDHMIRINDFEKEIELKNEEINRLTEELKSQENFWRSQHDELVFHIQKTQEGVQNQEVVAKERAELAKSVVEMKEELSKRQKFSEEALGKQSDEIAVLNKTIAALAKDKENTEKQFRAYSENFALEYDELQKKKHEICNSLIEMTHEVETWKKKYTDLERSNMDEVKKFKAERDELTGIIKQYEEKLESLIKDQDRISSNDNRIAVLEKEKEELLRVLIEMENSVDDRIRESLKRAEMHEREDVKFELNLYKKQINEVEERLRSLIEENERLRQECEQYKKKFVPSGNSFTIRSPDGKLSSPFDRDTFGYKRQLEETESKMALFLEKYREIEADRSSKFEENKNLCRKVMELETRLKVVNEENKSIATQYNQQFELLIQENSELDKKFREAKRESAIFESSAMSKLKEELSQERSHYESEQKSFQEKLRDAEQNNRDLRSQIMRLSDEIQRLTKAKELLEKELANLKNHSSSVEENLLAATAEREKLENAFNESLSELDAQKKAYAVLKAAQAKHLLENKALLERAEKESERVSMLQGEVQALDEANQEKAKEITSIHDDMERLESYYQGEIQELLNKIENLTAFDTENEWRFKLEAEKSLWDAKFMQQNKRNNELEREIVVLKKDNAILAEQLETFIKEIENLQDQCRAMAENSRNPELLNQLEYYKKSVLDLKELELRMSSEKSALESQNRILDEELKSKRKELEKAYELLSMSKSENISSTKQCEQLAQERNEYEIKAKNMEKDALILRDNYEKLRKENQELKSHSMANSTNYEIYEKELISKNEELQIKLMEVDALRRKYQESIQTKDYSSGSGRGNFVQFTKSYMAQEKK